MRYPNLSEDKRSAGSLVAFIDLLFLLVCFFVVLLYQTSKETREKQQQVEMIEQQMNTAEIVIQQLKPLAETGLNYLQKKKKSEQLALKKQERFKTREILRIEYEVLKEGSILYQKESMDFEKFMEMIVKPARKQYWLAFRSSAKGSVPFGKVIEIRKMLLKERNEFDTYWSNLQEKP